MDHEYVIHIFILGETMNTQNDKEANAEYAAFMALEGDETESTKEADLFDKVCAEYERIAEAHAVIEAAWDESEDLAEDEAMAAIAAQEAVASVILTEQEVRGFTTLREFTDLRQQKAN